MALPLMAIIPFAEKILDAFIPDKKKLAEAKLKLVALHQSGDLAKLTAETEISKGQLAINTIEAGHRSLFVAGWRPFIGWTCGVAFAFHFVVQPILLAILSIFDIHPIVPAFEMQALLTVLGGMLGLGGLRTMEKLKKVS